MTTQSQEMFAGLLILVYLLTQAPYSQQNATLAMPYDIANSNNHILNNLTRIETQLSHLQESQTTPQIIIAIVAAGGAVAGGFMTSYVTARRQEKKEQIEDDRKRLLNIRIKGMITIELQTYSEMLSLILKNSQWLGTVTADRTIDNDLWITESGLC